MYDIYHRFKISLLMFCGGMEKVRWIDVCVCVCVYSVYIYIYIYINSQMQPKSRNI